MRKAKSLFFTAMAWAMCNVVYSQTLLEKIESSQNDVKDEGAKGAEVFFGYMDIVAALVIAGWSVLAWRNAKRGDSEDGKEFNIVSFIMTKAGGLAGYVLIRILVINMLD